jgi:hypothetical protein
VNKLHRKVMDEGVHDFLLSTHLVPLNVKFNPQTLYCVFQLLDLLFEFRLLVFELLLVLICSEREFSFEF